MEFEIEQGQLLDVLKGASSTGRDEGIMTFKDDGWMIRCHSESTVVMFATKVPKSEMGYYDRDGVDTIGFKFDKIQKFLSSGSDSVKIESYQTDGGVNKVRAITESSTLEIPTVSEEYIEGNANSIPTLDWPVKITGDLGVFSDFIKDADGLVGSPHYMVGVRGKTLHLYTAHDDTRHWESYPLDSFDDHEVDWSVGRQEKDEFHNPQKDEAIDTILSTEWSKSMYFPSDKGTIYLGNHVPIRIVFDTDSDIKSAYFVSPRIPDTDTRAIIPADITQ